MTAWWCEERIHATVKQEYIERELGSKKHVDTLHGVLAFGDGLTDDTYLDWILERSPRIFLILNQIGVPEKIFEVIDKSFADDDLPLSQDALWELNLFGGKSETLDKKFYREQFNFLIQELEPGGHVEYGTWAVVPVDPVIKRPGIATIQTNSDKVQVHDKLYTRKKVASLGDNGIDEVHFIMHLKALTSIQHPHLVSVWATYSQDDFNYLLLTPPAETTLKVFLDEPPKPFKLLQKHERRTIFLTWTHCLTSALAFLHDKGFSHQAIRPSTIFIDHRNTIFFNDYSALRALDVDETNSPYSNELYDYSAPENWLRKPCLHETAPLKTYLPGGGRTSRRIPKPMPPNPKASLPLPCAPISPGLTRTASKSASSGSSTNTAPRTAIITTFSPPHRVGSIASSSSHNKRNHASDIFSHTTVLLTLLSQILQHTPKSFASHRSRLNRQAGRGNAPPDSSFHKNLLQVNKWIDMLAKEAGQREKKDLKFWGAVVEVVQACRLGIKKEAKERIGAKELEQKIAGWVEWGLARRRKCSCPIKPDEDVRLNGADDRMSEPEPASQYRIPQLQGNQQYLAGVKQKVEFVGDESGGRSEATSVDVQIGTAHPYVEPDHPYQESSVWGLGDLAHLHEGRMRSASVMSGNESTVWGLNDVSEDDRTSDFPSKTNNAPRSDSVYSVSSSCIAVGVAGGTSHYDDEDTESESSTDTQMQREDWPLPLGTLTLDHGMR